MCLSSAASALPTFSMIAFSVAQQAEPLGEPRFVGARLRHRFELADRLREGGRGAEEVGRGLLQLARLHLTLGALEDALVGEHVGLADRLDLFDVFGARRRFGRAGRGSSERQGHHRRSPAKRTHVFAISSSLLASLSLSHCFPKNTL